MSEQSSMREYLAAKLSSYRKSAGYTVYEVGEKIGKSGKTVSGWEHGLGQPDAEMLKKLCGLYQVNIAELFGMPLDGLTPDEDDLLNSYRQLNNDGKIIIKNTAVGLVDSGKYK